MGRPDKLIARSYVAALRILPRFTSDGQIRAA